jgi:hypothetical protein
LAAFGVTPNKTHTAEVIGLEDNRDFWRGVIDSDGSLYIGRGNDRHGVRKYHRPVLNVCGSRRLMDQFLAFASKHVKHRANVRGSHSIFTAALSGPAAAVMCRLLYAGNGPALARKQARAEEIIRLTFGQLDPIP